MSENKQQGLKGLRGLRSLWDLSEGERNKFYADNASILSKYSNNPLRYGRAAERIYNNQKFINAFGEDAFNQLNDGTKASYDYRNQLFRDKTIVNAFVDKFGKDSNFGEMSSQLDTDGMYSLLTNTEYLGENERKKRYDKTLNASKKVGKSFDAAINNPYIDAIGAGFMQWGKTESALRPSVNNADYAKKDKEILDRLYAETQQRRENEIKDDTDLIYANILEADENGNKSLAQSYKEFDAFATKNSPHYKTFKNSKWMKDYTNEDRLKDYAKFLALKQKYGETVAMNYLERNMQNKVADAQDGKWTGNTLKKVLTTAWSDLGSDVAVLSMIGKSPEEITILNMGKDPKKPIYDKKGNIIDYQRNDSWVTNPAYWNDVYKYNTFSPTEIKVIEERGGISEDVNVRKYGYTPDFLSWDTFEEGFSQSGHIMAPIIETALMGGLGKGAAFAGTKAMRLMGLSAKAMQTASKIGTITNDLLVGATSGLSGSQLEAMGTFEEQLQDAKEKIQNQINNELRDYQRSIDYNSRSSKNAIDAIYRQLKQKDNRRVALGNREGSKSFPLSDDVLLAQAKQLYTNQLLGSKQKELQELHKKDELEAARAAEKAYATNFIMDYVKNIPLTVGIQKYKIAKGSMRSTFDNTLKKNLVADAETGGVKRGFKTMIGKGKDAKEGIKVREYSSAKELGKSFVKQLAGGFADEYLDGINASFSSGIGNNEFDNYIRRNYDPKAYNATVDTFLGNMLSGMSSGIDGITDRENLYEGFIGMVSPLASTMVNTNAVFRPKDTWKAVVKGIDENGKKLSKVERLSSILMNPLLNEVAEAKEKDRAIDTAVETINKVVADNKDKLHDASKVISVLGNYENTLIPTDSPYSLLDSKDNKLLNAFTLINILNGLENVDGGSSTYLYKDTMDTLEGLANNNLSQEEMDNEIDKFLADGDNKSILDKGEEGRAIAKERLQKNAQYFMQLKDNVAKIENLFANSPSLAKIDPRVKTMLVYNIAASDDYKARLKELENGLGIGSTDTESLYQPNYNLRYANPQARNNAINARDREISKIQKEVDKNKEETEKAQSKLKSLSDDLKSTYDKDKRTSLQENIDKQRKLISSMEFERKSLEEVKSRMSREKEEISKVQDNNGFDENSILNADARDRAWILDPTNRDNFSNGKQAIIDNVTRTLQQKDPEALVKIRDAGILAQRIEDAKNTYDKVLRNEDLAANYLDVMNEVRVRGALSESLQSDINKYYATIGEAYLNRESDPNSFRKEIFSKSPELLKAYMEDHPNQADVIKPYYEILDFDEKAVPIIKRSDFSNEDKQALMLSLFNMQADVNSLDELREKLEGVLDSPDVEEGIKDKFEYLLSNLEKLGYQRDATVLETRKQKKEREEATRKKKEEEKKKLEEETKKAAEKKPEESTNVPTEENMGDTESVDLGNLWDTESTKEKEPTSKTEKEEPTKKEKEEEDTRSEEGNVKAQEKSTEHIDFDIIRKVPSNEYEDIPETAKHEENDTFEAHSADKKDGVWYFNGNFAGSKEQTTVKSTRDLDNKESQDGQSTTSEGTIIQGNDTAYANIEREGEDEIIESPTLDQQLEDSRGSGKEAYVSSQNEDSLDVNTKGELFNSNDVTTLSGNAMSRYVSGELEKNTLVNKKGEEGKGTSMDDFYAWMDAAGIKLQNIIDRELGRIISKNPHAKVKFMWVAPSQNATHDDHMKTHLMLVLDYDDKVNRGITAIHDNSNGGVIESNGKKYLVIGTAGYGNMNLSKRTLYDILFNPNLKDGLNIKSRARKFFETNPNERFYVTEDLSTEIVPYSIIPGYIIKKQVGEENTEFRNISDILANEKRNPLGYTMEDLGWGIQELQKFLLIGASPDQVMVPRNRLRNLGSAFVLVPASNGKFVPGYIKPCSYNEMREGSLKQRTDELLRKAVTQNDPKARKNAIIELGSIFYLDKNGNYILSRDSRNEVSLVHDGEVYKRFVLDDNFNPDAFIKAFEEIKPMVNITARVLNSPKLLKEYEEAGALTTDLALFSTAGSSYSIYALDKEGNMIVPKSPVNEAQKEADDSDFRRKESQVIYNHQYYMENDGVFTLHGNTITDEKTLEQLKYNKRIVDGKFTPVETKGENDVFILSTGDNPEVVSVNRNTKYVKVMPKEEAQKLIDRINEQRLKKEREEAAQKTMKKEAGQTNSENHQKGENEAEVELLADTKVHNYEVDPNTGELIVVDTPSKPSPKSSAEPILLQTEQGNHIFFQEDIDLAKQIILDNPSNPIAELQSKMELDYRTAKELAGKLGWKELAEDMDTSNKEPAKENTSNIPASTVNNGENKATTQNFVTLFKDKSHKKSISKVISEKWKDAPKKPGELNEYLRKKGIEVDNIGTSEKDISNWLRTLEDCK